MLNDKTLQLCRDFWFQIIYLQWDLARFFFFIQALSNLILLYVQLGKFPSEPQGIEFILIPMQRKVDQINWLTDLFI